MQDEFDIRYTEKADEQALLSWFSEEGELFHYPISEKREIAPFTRNWVAFSRFRAGLTAVSSQGTPLGMATLYLMPYRKLAHKTLFYVMVDPSFRRKGIGFSLVKNIVHLAQTKFSLESVYCEVFEGSCILPLLHQQSFSCFVEQNRYLKWGERYYKRYLLEKCFVGK